MKRFSIISYLVLAAVGGCVYVSCKPDWEFYHLKRDARKKVTAVELQIWATNLLAHHPNNGRVETSDWAPHFPPQLLKIAPDIGPDVCVAVPEERHQPPFVTVTWGSGFLGHVHFVVGPTNFTGGGGEPWSPGVYFYGLR